MIFRLKDSLISPFQKYFSFRFSISDGSGVVKQFERRFSRYLGVKYALAQNSGTSCLHAAFFALGIKPGDEILVPSYTWHSSISPALSLGGVPVFCENNSQTLTIDPKDVERKITKRTKAIVVVHLFGMPAQMNEIMRVARKHNLFVIEDCAHAYGSLYEGRKVGTFGDISCFSLQESKQLSGGEGGVFCTNNKDFYERALLLGHQGRIDQATSPTITTYHRTGLGFKYRPNPISISRALQSLSTFSSHLKENEKSGGLLDSLLSSIVSLKVYTRPSYCFFRSYYGYRFGYKGKTGLSKRTFISRLRKKGVPVVDEKELMPLLHREPLFSPNHFFSQIKKRQKLPATEKRYSEMVVLSLPSSYDEKILRSYVQKIEKILK